MQPRRRGVGSVAFLWRSTVLTHTLAKHKHPVTYTHKDVQFCNHMHNMYNTYMQAHGYTHTHMHTHTYACNHAVYVGNNIQAHCLYWSHIHSHTRAHTCTHIHTHTHSLEK